MANHIVSVRRVRIALVATTLLTVTQSNALTQNTLSVPTPDTAIGSSPLTTYDVGEIDNVNPINGNVFIQLPLLSFPQKGKSLRLTFRIYYNDKSWGIVYNGATTSAAAQGVGYWQIGTVQGVTVARDQNLVFSSSSTSYPMSISNGPVSESVDTTYLSNSVISADGSQHYYSDFAWQICNSANYGPGCPSVYNSQNAYPATDGSGYLPVFNSISRLYDVVDSSGVLYSASSGAITDIDGNSIQKGSNGWTDTVSRAIPGAATDPGLPHAPAPGNLSFVPDLVPGVEIAPDTNCPSGTKDARVWQVPAPPGTSATYYLCYSDYTYYSNFNIDALLGNTTFQYVAEAGHQTARLLSAIVLPNKTSYTFNYDNYLSLTNLTLPSGGSIAYTWQPVPFMVPYPTSLAQTNWPSSPVSRALSTRKIYPVSGQPPQVWTYHWYLNTSNSGIVDYTKPSWSVVTDPNGNDTEHQLGGEDANGNIPDTLVETATATYSGCSPHDTAANRTCSTSKSALMQSKTYGLSPLVSGGAQWNSASHFATWFPAWKRTTTITATPSAAGSLVTKTVVVLTPNYGSCTVSDLGLLESGGGTNPPPTVTTTSNCYAYDQQHSIAMYDYGIGSPGALHSTSTTTYEWQTGTTLGASFLSANLLDLPSTTTLTDGSGSTASETDYFYDEPAYVPAGTYGKMTSLTRVNSQGTSPTVHAYYNASGEMTEAVDAKSGSTSVTAFQCSGSLPQTIVNAAKQSSQYTFDCNTGLLTQFLSPNDLANGGSGTQYVYDSVRNPTLITHPDGGTMSIDYGSYSIPLTVTKKITATPDPMTTTRTKYDGFLKPLMSTLANGAVVDTTYDVLNRVSTVSNPHFAAPSPSDGLTTSYYDALGRVVQVQHPDTTSVWTCYNGIASGGEPNCNASPSGVVGSWVDTMDELQNDWQKLSDAEGQVREVVEPGSLLTSYTYDVLGNLRCVDQWGTASAGTACTSTHHRSFNYDSLSRLLTSFNPEAGTTSYSYDVSGSLCAADSFLPCTKTDSRGMTTSYQYDALNRMTSKTYTGIASQWTSVSTAASCYKYDTATNGIGKLGVAWTQQSSTLANGLCPSSPPAKVMSSRSVYAYDPMGRITQEIQCSASGCTTGSPRSRSYSYDLAGNLIGSTDGASGLSFASQYDNGGRLFDFSGGNSVSPSSVFPVQSLFSVQAYGPLGLINATVGNKMSLTRTYDNRSRLTSGTVIVP